MDYKRILYNWSQISRYIPISYCYHCNPIVSVKMFETCMQLLTLHIAPYSPVHSNVVINYASAVRLSGTVMRTRLKKHFQQQ